MATYAIGDIHGRLGALRTLLLKLDPEKDRLVFLGDYVDRGPDSAGVLDLLVQVAMECPRTVFLRGNHDWLMVGSRDDAARRQYWRDKCGGEATLASYPMASLDEVPMAHWFFLEKTCRDVFETENHIYVHGGVEADLPMVQQSVRQLHWRRLHEAAPHCSGKRVICGHTQQRSGLPINLGHTVCVDTKGWLTALNVNTNTFVQAGNGGEWREFSRLPSVSPVPAAPISPHAHAHAKAKLPEGVVEDDLDEG